MSGHIRLSVYERVSRAKCGGCFPLYMTGINSCFVKEKWKIKVCFNKQRSVTIAGLAAGVSLHLAAVLHSAVVGDLHRLAYVGLPALQHLFFVQFLVHAERHQFGAGQPLPGHTSQCAWDWNSVKLQAKTCCFLTRKVLKILCYFWQQRLCFCTLWPKTQGCTFL